MKRFKAYDPKEYVDWTPCPETQKAYRELADAARIELGAEAGDEDLIARYRDLLRVRYQDVALKRWVKQGKISKAWLGTGEEAVTVGNLAALGKGDLVGPMIRNAGALILKGMPLATSLGYYLGVFDNPSKGRDLHAGSLEYDVITPISHVAALVPVIAGAAMAMRLKSSDRVAMTWIGDGSTRTGEFHEGVNFAAVDRSPVIFVLQNNNVALGTKYEDHYTTGLESLASGYGLPGLVADGNNVLDVWRATAKAVAMCRAGEGPVMLTVNTFRMGGHATHDEAEARHIFDQDTWDMWGKRDPVGCFEEYLKETGVVTAGELDAIDKEIEAETSAAAAEALQGLETRFPPPETVTDGVYAD